MTASRTITVSANTLAVGGVSGTGFGLTKEGPGTLVCKGPIPTTEWTMINNGTLQLGNGSH